MNITHDIATSLLTLANRNMFICVAVIDVERQKIDCLMTRTACLVCFISTVNDCNKKRKEDYYKQR
jgi:hypothetical protein